MRYDANMSVRTSNILLNVLGIGELGLVQDAKLIVDQYVLDIIKRFNLNFVCKNMLISENHNSEFVTKALDIDGTIIRTFDASKSRK